MLLSKFAKQNLPIVLSMGEPAGIGGEITWRAWRELSHSPNPTVFFVLADVNYLNFIAKSLNFDYPLAVIDEPSQAFAVFSQGLPVLPLTHAVRARLQQPQIANAAAVLESLERGVELCLNKQAAAIVTNPIHKATLKQSGFSFQGHSDYLAHLCGLPNSAAVMMLVSESLRTVPVTVHIPLNSVAQSLSAELIKSTARTTIAGLKEHFAIKQPILYVAGLNPHAGEAGRMGEEENNFINAAIADLQAEKLKVYGTFAADSLFHKNMRQKYHAALCMYHDQALIPIKTLDFEHAINITLGLPIIRTSPDHGTALDIVGQGCASPHSLIAAIHNAASMAQAKHR